MVSSLGSRLVGCWLVGWSDLCCRRVTSAASSALVLEYSSTAVRISSAAAAVLRPPASHTMWHLSACRSQPVEPAGVRAAGAAAARRTLLSFPTTIHRHRAAISVTLDHRSFSRLLCLSLVWLLVAPLPVACPFFHFQPGRSCHQPPSLLSMSLARLARLPASVHSRTANSLVPVLRAFSSSAAPTYSLPPLPYDYGALEPAISGQIMETHHKKHHQTYVNNLNAAVAQLQEAQHNKHDASKLVQLQAAINFNGGGHINHSIFWTNLAPKQQGGGHTCTAAHDVSLCPTAAALRLPPLTDFLTDFLSAVGLLVRCLGDRVQALPPLAACCRPSRLTSAVCRPCSPR